MDDPQELVDELREAAQSAGPLAELLTRAADMIDALDSKLLDACSQISES